jgi:signal transduction histidine kinase
MARIMSRNPVTLRAGVRVAPSAHWPRWSSLVQAVSRVSPTLRAEGRLGIASIAAAAALLVVAQLGWPIDPLLAGSLACLIAFAHAAVRRANERIPWTALSLAAGGLAVGSALGSVSGHRFLIAGAVNLADAGLFAFATLAAVASLAWPEIRDEGRRLIATLIDTAIVAIVAVVAATQAVAMAGGSVPPVALPAIARSGELLLPAITAALALAQMAPRRRPVGLLLLGGTSALFLGAVLVARGSSGDLPTILAGRTFESAAFALLVLAAPIAVHLAPQPGPAEASAASPPFTLPGAVGLIVLLLAVVGGWSAGPLGPVPLVLLGVCLLSREALLALGRRRSVGQLEASADFEARLLAIQAQAPPELSGKEGLRRWCALAAEALSADAALAWIADGDTLVLDAVAPPRREALAGRRLPLREANALAVRAFRTTGSAGLRGPASSSPDERFLFTVLDAGWSLGVPIRSQARPVGALVLVRDPGRSPFSRFEIQKARLLAGQIAASLHRLKLYDEIENHEREVQLVHRFAQWTPTAKSANDIAWQLLQSIRTQLPFEHGTVYLGNGASATAVRPIARFGGRLPSGEDVQVSWCIAPLQCAEQVFGRVEIARVDGESFSASEQRTVGALAQQAAIGIQNQRLQEESGKASVYRDLSQQKTERLNAISHDLRGPLANIKGYAETLSESGAALSDEDRDGFLVTIQEEADRLRDLLDGLLDLSQLEAGVMAMEREPLNLWLLAQRTAASFPPSDHRLQLAMPDDLFVLGDRRRVGQVLHNLIGNAIKYSPQGGKISLAAARADDGVLVTVSDQGVGIPRHQWNKIFEPYHRAETTGKIGGTGLGLAICKGIVEAHGGRIWVESTPGVGSTFSFTLPLARVPDPDPIPNGHGVDLSGRSGSKQTSHAARSTNGQQEHEGNLHRRS